MAIMHKIKLIIFIICVVWVAGCYQWTGELNTRITGTALKPDGNIIAIGIIEYSARYPLLGAGGWSRGIPKIHGIKGEIYFYRIKEQKIDKQFSIRSPRRWDDTSRFRIIPYIWEYIVICVRQ